MFKNIKLFLTKRGYKLHNILEYLIIIIQIFGFGILSIKLGIFIGKMENKLENFDCRIKENHNRINNLYNLKKE